MTHENDPDDIEAGLERNRSGLATTLDELSNRASVDYVAREALGMLKINTSDATRSLDHAIRANPMAFALVGVGVAWMIFGGKSSNGGAKPGGAKTGWTQDEWRASGVDDPNPEWHSHLGGLRSKARDTLHQIDTEARSSVQALKSNLSDQVENVRDYAAERAHVIETFAADLKSAVADGLEHLSETARAGIMQARQESYAALLRAERVVKGGTREAVAVVEEHPVAIGAAAMAVGALAGLALMQSGKKDRNSPSYWTKGQGQGQTRGKRGTAASAYRGTWAQGSGAGLAGLRGGQGVAPVGGPTAEMVSTGGAGNAPGPYGGTDSEGPLPPV